MSIKVLHTLELSITSLDLFVISLLYVALENSSSRRFVEAGGFQNVRRIDPVVGLAPHYMLSLCIWAYKLEFPDGILQGRTC